MGNLVIKVDMNGAAFEDENELPRILHLIAEQYVQGNRGKGILDVNGNRVGQWTIEPTEPDYPEWDD